MKPEPLKGKREYVNEHELRVEEDCHPTTVTAVYTEDDIKAAVHWLKQRMLDKNIVSGDDFLNHKKDYADMYFSREQINDWIDEAFQDVTEESQVESELIDERETLKEDKDEQNSDDFYFGCSCNNP